MIRKGEDNTITADTVTCPRSDDEDTVINVKH